jgi:predicted AlkP superfamily phosphohydrolase/phosphomutase
MKKLMLIGIDGGTWNNLMPWIKAGELPAFAKLISEGSRGILHSTIPANTYSALPCFFTGQNLGKTGIFSLMKNGRLIKSSDIEGKRFWEYLCDNKIEPFICGLRMTYPPTISSGLMVSGDMLIPSSKSEKVTYPRNEFFKDYHMFLEEKDALEKTHMDNKEKLKDVYIKIGQSQYSLFKKYLKSNKHDFVLFYNTITDNAQHFLWDRPDLLLEVYKEVDRILSDTLNSFSEYNFLLFSDHGFEKEMDGIFYFNTWLKKQGYVKTYGGAGGAFVLSHMQKFFEKNFSLDTLGKIMKFFGKSQNAESAETSEEYNLKIPGINWSKTKAYLSVPWGISILKENVEDFEKTKEDLYIKMQSLVEEGVLREVHKLEDIYWGPKTKHFPDIVFLLNGDRFACVRPTLSTGLFGTKPAQRAGHHDFNRKGIIIGWGHDVEKTEEPLSGQIYDIGPTVLDFFGIPIPSDMDGEPMRLFKEK